MKKFLAMILSLVLACSLLACGADKGDEQGAEGWARDWGITMTAENVSATGLTLICRQSGGIAEGSLETGSAYTIERKDGDTWLAIEPQAEPVWDMMSHLIESDGETEWTIDWSWLYGELSPGTYRICKTIMDFKDSGVSESQIYFAEFSIEQ